jgi:toxin CcdB
LLHALATRLTIPLAAIDGVAKVPASLCPAIMVKGQRVNALAHFATPLPTKVLKHPVDNVAAQASALAAAVLSGV